MERKNELLFIVPRYKRSNGKFVVGVFRNKAGQFQKLKKDNI
jgi:hypothetical protein